jgi:hypothetical protein
MLRAVILLGDQLPVPGEDGVRGDDTGHFLQRLLTQSLAQFGERLPLSVAQAHAARDLLA